MVAIWHNSGDVMLDEAVAIEPVQRQNLRDLQEAASGLGMSRSLRYFNRCFFNPFVRKNVKADHGFLLRNSSGRVVGFQCHYFTRLFFKRQEKLGCSACYLGILPEYASWLCDLIQREDDADYSDIFYGNATANQKSYKVATCLRDMKPGPERCAYVSYAFTSDLVRFLAIMLKRTKRMLPTHPRRVKLVFAVVDFLTKPLHWIVRIGARRRIQNGYEIARMMEFENGQFKAFWERFLQSNEGVVSSREPDILRWMFADSLHNGRVVLLVASKQGKMEGYVLLRKYTSGCFHEDYLPCYIRYKIIDICAVGNDLDCLNALVSAAISYARFHNGCTVEFIGGLPGQEEWLDPHMDVRLPIGVQTTVYRTKDPNLEIELFSKHSWFFGPYDGERCMGHGEYIDL